MVVSSSEGLQYQKEQKAQKLFALVPFCLRGAFLLNQAGRVYLVWVVVDWDSVAAAAGLSGRW